MNRIACSGGRHFADDRAPRRSRIAALVYATEKSEQLLVSDLDMLQPMGWRTPAGGQAAHYHDRAMVAVGTDDET